MLVVAQQHQVLLVPASDHLDEHRLDSAPFQLPAYPRH